MPFGKLFCQDVSSSFSQNISYNFNKQLHVFPQEKIYVQNDKPYYIGGENIWFRIHLVNAATHLPNSLSRYVYGELISPDNKLVSRVKIRPVNNAQSGYFKLPENLADGDYLLRFYTRLMEAADKEYFFTKTVTLGNPLSTLYRTNASFTYEKDDILAEIQFVEIKKQKIIKPKDIKIGIGNDSLKGLNINKEESALKLKFKRNNVSGTDALYVEYNYDNKLHKQFISIPNDNEIYDVSFYPEGGTFLSGTNIKIAFKSLNNNGLGESVKGIVLNERGDTLTNFTSNKLGMGCFVANAKYGEKLYVVCENEKGIIRKFDLPSPVNKGLSLQIAMAPEWLNIRVSSPSDTNITDSLNLVIHCRGKVLHSTAWNSKENLMYIAKHELPSGVIQVLLTNKNNVPLSERLIFNLNKNDIVNVIFSTNKPYYDKREQVVAGLNLKNQQGNPLKGSFSVAVTDDNDVSVDNNTNIISTFLLSSDLRGYIENSAYYFNMVDCSVKPDIDYLMMTQGWSRYDIKNILHGKIEPCKGIIEIGPYISGLVKKDGLFSKGGSNDQVKITTISDVTTMNFTLETDDKGRFAFEEYELQDGTKYLIRAFNKEGGSRVELVMDQETFPDLQGGNIGKIYPSREKRSDFEDYLIKADQKFVSEFGNRMIFLKEVEVTAQDLRRGKSRLSHPFNTIVRPEEIAKKAKIYPNLGQMLLDIPRVDAMDEITVLGHPPVIYLDDIPLRPSEYGRLKSINSIYIDEIEVATDNTGGLGPAAILITTKSGTGFHQVSESFNSKAFIPLGYQVTKEFYSPKYETDKEKKDSTPDLRSTIYWNPNVITDENGKANFDFYTADSKSTYSVIIEGTTSDGKIIYYKGSIMKD